MKRIASAVFLLLSAIVLFWATFLPANAQNYPKLPKPAGTSGVCTGSTATLTPAFAVDYSCASLGSVPGVPINYGGLTLKYNNPNILLIGGGANGTNGRIYQISVVRGTGNHIVSFTGTATVYPTPTATIGINVDGGVTFGPGNVLFVARYPNNELEETKPGSSAPDKVVNLTAIPGGGVSSSVGALGFVPAGFPGAGQLKAISYNSGGWYTVALAPDANGTYDATSATLGPVISGGPEGLGFVPAGSPVFPGNSCLIALYNSGKVITAPLDANGNPVMVNAQDFITGLVGSEGTFIDPITGDLLFSTFGGNGQVIRVTGFSRAPVPSSAVSRKTHGAAGTFNISLLDGGVECRNGTPSGTDYTVITTFAAPVTVGGTIITSADNMATAEPVAVTSTTVTVNLHNVSNAQRVGVILTNVNDGTLSGDVLIPFPVLIGDTNTSGTVTASDVGQVKSLSGQAVDGTNFRADVTASGGTINASDVGLVKSRSGTQLP